MTATTIKQKRDPKPAEIAERCAEIQLSWSQQERMRRLRPDWRPQVRAGDGRLVAVTAGDFEAHQERVNR